MQWPQAPARLWKAGEKAKTKTGFAAAGSRLPRRGFPRVRAHRGDEVVCAIRLQNRSARSHTVSASCQCCGGGSNPVTLI